MNDAPATRAFSAPAVVLITGAGGFIGSAIAQALAAQGTDVRAGVRSASAPHGRATPCDLDKPDQVRAALSGVDVVIHAAYGSVSTMEQQCNTVLEAMATAGTTRLVYMSSIAVYGDAAGRIDETFAGPATLDAYGKAKLSCEAAVGRWAATPGRAAIILRPGIVYGTGSALWIEKMAARIRAGIWGRFGEAGEGIAALIHSDDLTALACRAVRSLTEDHGTLSGAATLNAIGPETPSWNGYFTALARHLDLPLRDLSLQEMRYRQYAAMAAKLWRRIGLPGAEAAALFPMPGELALFARKAHYAMERTQAVLGIMPVLGLKEGLARTVPQTKK